jgi:hypothetical protein
MGTHRPIVYFGPDPWVLILSRTQPVGPHGSVGPWEPAGSVAAYSHAMMRVKFLFDARDACTCKSSLSKLLERGSAHASLERLTSTDASLLAL